jgi:hypothetical protein
MSSSPTFQCDLCQPVSTAALSPFLSISEGGSLRAPEKCVISISGSFVHSPDIQLQFLESWLLTHVCNLLPVLIYIARRHAHPDDATMEDVKKSPSDNDIEFNQPKDRIADRCRELAVGWWTRDGCKICFVVEGTHCSVMRFIWMFMSMTECCSSLK